MNSNIQEISNRNLSGEMLDLKNNIMALAKQMANVVETLHNMNRGNDKANELLNIIHNQNFEKSKYNNILFEQIYPDIIRRINTIENKLENPVNTSTEVISIDASMIPVGCLNFTTARPERALEAEGIKTIQHLLRCSEADIMKIPNISVKSLDEIKNGLKIFGLKLKGSIHER